MTTFATRALTALFTVAALFAGMAMAADPARPLEFWDPLAQKGEFKWKPITPAAGATGKLAAPKWDVTWKSTAAGLRAAVFDVLKYPEERKKLEGNKGFPNLGRDFEVTAPSTGHPDEPETVHPGVKTYNCIAWSLGVTDRWVWPGESVKAFDELYATKGYKRLATRDLTVEPGVEKVVLYGKLKDVRLKGPDGKVHEEVLLAATHAARQEIDGTWTSKLGGLARIRHRTPEAVAGGSYGDPIAVYARPRQEKRTGLPPLRR